MYWPFGTVSEAKNIKWTIEISATTTSWPETERWSHYAEAVLPQQFDAYCWFDRTHALPPIAEYEPRGGSADDLYPFGP